MESAFIISYVITMILTLDFIYCVYKGKYWVFEFANRIKNPIQQLVYVLLMFTSSFFYAYLSLRIEGSFNAAICAVSLLFSIWAADFLFSISFKENSLGISDKKRYIFMAYVGACISGFIITYRDHSELALEISNITISVLIGAYVPFTFLLDDGTNGKIELQKVKQEWKIKYNEILHEHKFKGILSALLFAMVYGVLLGVALSPAESIINDITSGIGRGIVTMVIAFVGLVEVKKRLTKRKKEVRKAADQEKAHVE